MAAKIDVLAFNRVIGLGVHQSATEADVDAIVDAYRDAGVSRFFVQLSPYAQPELVEWLTARGFVQHNRWMKLVRDARDESPPAHSTLQVEEVSPSTRDAFTHVIARAYGMPDALRPWVAQLVGREGWTHYVAMEDGTAVAAGSLQIVGDRAWTGFAGTLPEMRARGAQSVLIARRIEDARRAGCRWIICETAEDAPGKPAPSLHNQLRFGYRVLYARPNLLWKNDAPS
jgi:GNAT superfamily N-acetyltransferase